MVDPDTLEGLKARIVVLEAELTALQSRKEREYRRPTYEEIRQEIELGPLAAQCKPHWLDVFEPHPNTTPHIPGTPSLREKLRHREGMLKSDAAFAIHKILLPRAEELGWDLSDYKEVLRAHQDRRRREVTDGSR